MLAVTCHYLAVLPTQVKRQVPWPAEHDSASFRQLWRLRRCSPGRRCSSP